MGVVSNQALKVKPAHLNDNADDRAAVTLIASRETTNCTIKLLQQPNRVISEAQMTDNDM